MREVITMNWVDYRERLGIGLEDKKKFQMCINRIMNVLSRYAGYYTDDDLLLYINTVGEDFSPYTLMNVDPFQYALDSVRNTKTLKEFISKYVALINSSKETRIIVEGNKKIYELLESVMIDTLETYRIPYDIIHDDEGVFVFPKGIPEFDRDLVNKPFLWLSRYPETEKAWAKALKAYSNGEDPSDIADQFRKSLECFFQSFFKIDKTLENMKSIYGQYLKDHEIPGEIAGNLETLLQQYMNFINSHAKHHDRTSKHVLEYIMYQTGNIMRLLIKLADEDYKNNRE